MKYNAKTLAYGIAVAAATVSLCFGSANAQGLIKQPVPASSHSPAEAPPANATLPKSSTQASTVPVPPTGQQDEGGAGDLLIAPTRVVLDTRQRASEVTLSNRGSKAATYRVSFTHLKMGDDGAYTEINEKEAKGSLPVADELLRFSPHQVTLQPGESQIVKIVVRKPEGLADGEYISHMMFRAVPDASTGEDVEATSKEEGKIAIRLVPIYGVSIPVIVRHGALNAQASMTAQRKGSDLALSFTRSGSKSLYGDIIAQDSKGNVAAQARGFAVLVPNTRRDISIPLKSPATGPLTVQYRERAEDGGKTLATATVQ